MANFIPDNTFLPGFYMDVPGIDTYDEQIDAITLPAVDLGTLPENVFKTSSFGLTASLLNPWGGDQIDDPQMRLTIGAISDLATGDVTVTSTVAAFTDSVVESVVGGNLVWTWVPTDDLKVDRGDIVSTPITVTFTGAAPAGDYTFDLALDGVEAAPAAVVVAEMTRPSP